MAMDHGKRAQIGQKAFTWKEALPYPDQDMWIDAIKVELNGLSCNKTFKGRPLPEEQQPITAKFVFGIEYREDGTVLEYKVRLVIRGFTHTQRRVIICHNSFAKYLVDSAVPPAPPRHYLPFVQLPTPSLLLP